MVKIVSDGISRICHYFILISLFTLGPSMDYSICPEDFDEDSDTDELIISTENLRVSSNKKNETPSLLPGFIARAQQYNSIVRYNYYFTLSATKIYPDYAMH